MVKFKNISWILCGLPLVIFLACGGGGGESGVSSGPAAPCVTGVAATGMPIAGTVYLKDSAGHEISAASGDGTYTFNITGLTAPFMLKVEWVVNSTTLTLYSCATGSGTANINPLSNLIVAVAAGGVDPGSLYATPAQFAAIAANLSAASTGVRTKLQPLFNKYNTDTDPITGSFTADHTGLDLLFDNIQVTLTNGASQVSIMDISSGSLALKVSTSAIGSAPAAQSWSNPDALIARDPDVAVDVNGRAIVVWSQQLSGTYNIIARGPASETPVSISGGAENSGEPRIATDGSGNAIVVWTQCVGSSSTTRIWTARYASGSGWGAPMQLSTNASGFASGPKVASDSAGNAIAVWSELNTAVNPNHADVFFSRYTKATGLWSSPAMLTNGTNNAHNPHIALNAGGDGLAVWTQDQGNGSVSNDYFDVWGLAYSASGGWGGTATKLNSIPGNRPHYMYDQIAVALDAGGNGMAVWVQADLSLNEIYPFHIWAGKYTAGAGWGTAVVISNNVAGDCYGPDIAMDASGNAIAVWEQQDGVSTAFAAANRFSGGAWGTSGGISDGTGPVLDVHIKTDSAGNARAVWYQPQTGLTAIRSNAYTAGSGWGSATLVSTLPGVDGYMIYPVPRIGMNSAGASFTIWGMDSM